MLTSSFAPITTVLLGGPLAVMLALTSPAAARGGGHHHGECGEHHGYDCGDVYAGHHHRRQHEHYFEDHHRSEYPRDIRYPRPAERMPSAPDASTGSPEPK